MYAQCSCAICQTCVRDQVFKRIKGAPFIWINSCVELDVICISMQNDSMHLEMKRKRNGPKTELCNTLHGMSTPCGEKI